MIFLNQRYWMQTSPTMADRSLSIREEAGIFKVVALLLLFAGALEILDNLSAMFLLTVRFRGTGSATGVALFPSMPCAEVFHVVLRWSTALEAAELEFTSVKDACARAAAFCCCDLASATCKASSSLLSTTGSPCWHEMNWNNLCQVRKRCYYLPSNPISAEAFQFYP